MISDRKRLAELLATAAELEHSVMCQYLFAAASMKTTIAEGGVTYAQLEQMRVWRARIFTVARQEMEHLGIVLNLLSAIGEAPIMRRRNFPFTVTYGEATQQLALLPFSIDTIRSFALIEMPQDLLPGSAGWDILSGNDPTFAPGRFDLIAKLYDEVDVLIERLPEEMLFIGPPAAQFVNESIMPLAIRGLSGSGPVYNVNLTAVTNRQSALAAVGQIKTEGEGAQAHGGPGSHFSVFLEILEGLMAETESAFRPARNVLSNPTLAGVGPNVITHRMTTRVMQLFDMCYETLVISLTRYFASTDESSADEYALERAAFFPMMTTVIRPLAECLTFLPAHDQGDDCAGASFVLPFHLQFLPHRDAAFEQLHQNYTQMVDCAHELSTYASAPGVPAVWAAQGDRLTQVYEGLWRSRLNLQRQAGLEPRDE
jgi:hypothetical protein